MKFDLKGPCNNCPFLRDTDMVLRPGRMAGIVRSLLSDYNTFPCHKTTHDDPAKEQACIGALAYARANDMGLPVMARIALAQGHLKMKVIEKCAGQIEKPGCWKVD